MARYTDHAPVPPTCPLIDEVITFIESIEWNLEDEHQKVLASDAKHVLLTLESIREANASLREWGNDKHNDCEDAEEWERKYDDMLEEKNEFERKYDKVTDRVSDLEDDVYNLVRERDNLQDQVSELQNEISSLRERNSY